MLVTASSPETHHAYQPLLPPPVPSGHQHPYATGEKHPKEPGGKGKKNRNLKIGKITVSEKWRESVFRQITNANELKYLDEFLLNKVGGGGPGLGTLGAGAPRRAAPDQSPYRVGTERPGPWFQHIEGSGDHMLLSVFGICWFSTKPS